MGFAPGVLVVVSLRGGFYTGKGITAAGSSDAVTYVDVFRQHLVRQLVFLQDVVVGGRAGDHRAEEEAVDSRSRES